MTTLRALALAGIGCAALVSPALAQDAAPADQTAAGASDLGDEAIVVTARRRNEALQDVPLVVQAVTGSELDKLNLREFREIQSVVPGLSLSQDTNGIGTKATLRGIAYDLNASGSNGTIEFYLNEAPTAAPILFQSMFDVAQIEVLRGPQGTLRGRASPSGSITVATRRPDLNEAGFFGTGQVNSWGEFNVQGAVNVPIVQDRLAVRVAGVIDDTDSNRVHSINRAGDPSRKTQGGRVSLRFDPIDELTLNASYTQSLRDTADFVPVESANLADPTLPASPLTITAKDRKSVLRVLNTYRQSYTVWNWSAQLRLLGQKLDYVGSKNNQNFDAAAPNDMGAVLPATSPADFIAAAQVSRIRGTQKNHEIRLSSDERVAGMFDYVVGALFNDTTSPTMLDVQTPVFRGTTAVPLLLNHTAVIRTGASQERSFFGNVTAHLGEATEISGGIRRIRFHSTGGLTSNGAVIAAANEDRVLHATIFSASAKHNFTRDLMVYANFGTSWRPGSSSNPIQLRNQSKPAGVLASLLLPDPEKSKSYEIGLKSSWFDNKLRVNLDAFHQTFENFAYAAPNVFYLSDVGGVPGVSTITTFTVGVPAKVTGAEVEIGANPLPNWTIDATAAYAKGKISNAVVPCNNYGGRVPTVAQLLAATGGEQVSTCTIDKLRAGTTSPFVATLQSSYDHPLSDSKDGYLRGLVSYYGKSKNDPLNVFDDIPAYALVNLYAGLRAHDGSWDFGFYAKNLFDTDRVLTRAATGATSGASVAGGTAPVSSYRVISLNPPREIGVTLRLAVGSR